MVVFGFVLLCVIAFSVVCGCVCVVVYCLGLPYLGCCVCLCLFVCALVSEYGVLCCCVR